MCVVPRIEIIIKKIMWENLNLKKVQFCEMRERKQIKELIKIKNIVSFLIFMCYLNDEIYLIL